MLTYPLGLWQAMTPDHDPFGEFCTIFDNATTLHESILAYANYIGKAAKDACGDEPINRCLDTHDPKSPQFTDLKAEHRAWMYQVCTEVRIFFNIYISFINCYLYVGFFFPL